MDMNLMMGLISMLGGGKTGGMNTADILGMMSGAGTGADKTSQSSDPMASILPMLMNMSASKQSPPQNGENTRPARKKEEVADLYSTPFARENGLGTAAAFSAAPRSEENPMSSLLPMLMNMMGAKQPAPEPPKPPSAYACDTVKHTRPPKNNILSFAGEEVTTLLNDISRYFSHKT